MNLNQSIPELKSIIDLKEEEIPLIPLRGGTLVEWINRDYFRGSNLKQVLITDNDVDDYTDLVRDIQLDPGNSRYAWHTHRREMENYLPMESIEAEFGISLADYAEGWYERDVPHLLHGLCMLTIRDSHKREVAIKGRLNNSITKKLTKADLESIDAWEEIELWFRKIRAIVDGTYVEQTHD